MGQAQCSPWTWELLSSHTTGHVDSGPVDLTLLKTTGRASEQQFGGTVLCFSKELFMSYLVSDIMRNKREQNTNKFTENDDKVLVSLHNKPALSPALPQ